MLACERHGSGEPLVLIHGVTHRRQIWYPVLDRLIEHREVILVDLPGHGGSDELELGGRRIEPVVGDYLREFLLDEGLDRPHVAGNSLGGRVALVMAANGDARSVTAFSPAGFWRSEASFAHTRHIFQTAAALVERFGPQAEKLAHSRAGRSVMYGTLMSHPGRVPRDHAIGDIRAFRNSLPALRAFLADATPFTMPIDPSVPITIAWGARDLVLPRWQSEVARVAMPHAELVVMHGVGHVPIWDGPDQVARILLRGSASVAQIATLAQIAPIGRAAQQRRAATA